jgi:hypothetical protein
MSFKQGESTMSKTESATPKNVCDMLHWPDREKCFEDLEVHIAKAARLSRALWEALGNDESIIDERTREALQALAGEVADQASAVEALYYLERRGKGVRPLAGERMTPALASAIGRHEAANQAVERVKGPEDIQPELADAEEEALQAIGKTPCADDAELIGKLQYLFTHHRKTYYGNDGWRHAESPEIMTALALHFGAGAGAKP